MRKSAEFASSSFPYAAAAMSDLTELAASEAAAVDIADAHRPDRRYTVDSSGLGISVAEWGPPTAPPVLFAHGGFDFAETLNVFAPMMVARGWRVVSWDHRGHGQSEWADLYSWEADTRDAMWVLDAVGSEALPVIGHSKGGAMALQLAHLAPHRLRQLVNLDGLPSGRSMPDVADHERTRMLAAEMSSWLDHRREVGDKVRRAGTIAELAERRGRMNTRMRREWLEYLVTVGGRRDEDGWRWRIDPCLRIGGFGPWKPEWSMQRLPGVSMPFLGVLACEVEVMGWGTRPEDVEPNLPLGGRLETLEGVGHFVHIEQPELICDMICEFLGAPTG